jgi:hypothetical protein
MFEKMIKTILLGMMFLPVAKASELNDLSPYQSVKLDINLRTYQTYDGRSDIFYTVTTPYTNPLICSVDITVPVIKDGIEASVESTQENVVIFPAEAFEKPLSYRVDSFRLPLGRKVQTDLERVYSEAATCRGWSLGKRLPRRTCIELNPKHEESCMHARSSDKTYYPVIRNDLHLGDCGC